MTEQPDLAWFVAPTEHNDDEGELAVELVGDAAREALFAVVRASFEQARERGVRLSDMAVVLGVSPQAVGRLLRSSSNMRVETAGRLMYAMGEELQVGKRVRWPDAGKLTSAMVGAAAVVRVGPRLEFDTPAPGMQLAYVTNAGKKDGTYERISGSTQGMPTVDLRWLSGPPSPPASLQTETRAVEVQ